MKYVQPYGISDPEASYINGNPATGTMGSIPPAASIEHPQREIVNAISLAKTGAGAAFAAPNPADLAQLADVIQSGLFNYARDAGTANAYQVTLSPVPNAYYEGLTVVMRVGNENTGASVLNVNAMGAKPIVNNDGSALTAGAMIAGETICLVYDLITDKFRLVWASRVAGQQILLTAPKTIYVNHVTGLDTYDGSSATVTGGHGPVKTLTGAANIINKFNLNGFDVNVFVADSVLYDGFLAPVPGGNGTIYWNGNWTTLGNVTIAAVNKSTFTIEGGRHAFRGFKLTNSGTNTDGLCNVIARYGTSRVVLTDMDYGQCGGAHIALSRQAYVELTGSHRISGAALGNSLIGAAFVYAYYSATLDVDFTDPPSLVFTSPVSFGTFAKAALTGSIGMIFSSISGAADASSKKYHAMTNGIIHTSGAGVGYYPGGVAGSIESGGQYV